MSEAFRDAVRMEVVRIATIRATYVLLGTAVGLGALVALMFGTLTSAGAMSGDDTATALTMGGDVVPLSVVGLLVAVLGVTTVSHDYRYGLVRAVLTAQPRRGVLVRARLAVLGVVAAVSALLTSVLGAGLCVLSGHRPVLDGTTLRMVLVHAGVVVGWAWIGAGLTWIVRNATGVVALLLAGPLAVEPLLLLMAQFRRTAFLGPIVRWLPFSAARQALGPSTGSGALLAPLPAAVTFAVAAVLVVVVASSLLQRRDA